MDLSAQNVKVNDKPIVGDRQRDGPQHLDESSFSAPWSESAVKCTNWTHAEGGPVGTLISVPVTPSW